MTLSLVIHGHYYQPPRENPFLDEVDSEPSAYPFHDWNQRIERECYRAVIAARITGERGRIRRIVNTLEWTSFNVGPTLLEWLEREARDTYAGFLAADRASAARLGGHGNAIAQPYHHTILPLASRRDKQSEVRWGIADFKRRFGRDPEGMWLPETALDDETLDVLAAEGIRFTIVAPHQISRPSRHGRPVRYRTSTGRTIVLCPYHGELSHAVAFGGMLHDALAWVARMRETAAQLATPTGTPPSPAKQLGGVRPTSAPVPGVGADLSSIGGDQDVVLAIATDGETYGHHHKFGEMALARALEEMGRRGARVENFASLLARDPVLEDTGIVAPTSWSCPHGVERWRSNCGCRLDWNRNPSQAWRTPLRTGLEQAAVGLHSVYDREGRRLMRDPWAARDAFGTVVAGGTGERAAFAAGQAKDGATPDEVVRVRELLEMERDAMRMFTSCGWFFDDIGGLEPKQLLRYAARAISLVGEDGASIEATLLNQLSHAVSNDRKVGTGRDIYLRDCKPRLPAAIRIAAAAAAASSARTDEPLDFGGVTITIEGETVHLEEPRTGRPRTLHAHVSSLSPAGSVVIVADEAGQQHTLDVDDFPERFRRVVRSRLRRSILPRVLTAEELSQLMAGDVTIGGLVRVALIRTLTRLGREPEQEVMHLASDLIDLFRQFEAKLPFDAQTAFWRVWHESSELQRARLAPFLERLGFSPDEVLGEAPAS